MKRIVRGWIATVVVAGLGFSNAQAQQSKPNILVIWGDDIGTTNVSAYSDGVMGYETPNIDRIANEGLRFLQYYGEQSCTAGRSAFLTGQHVMRTGLSKVGFPGAPMGMSQLDPSIGGLLGEYSPRAPFWFAAGLSAVAFLYGLLILPESLRPEARMKFSWARANPFGAMKLLARHPELSGLAVVNFLPIPALDGGYFAFLGLEAVRRRPLPRRVQAYLGRVGMIWLCLIMAGTLVNDVLRLAGH